MLMLTKEIDRELTKQLPAAAARVGMPIHVLRKFIVEGLIPAIVAESGAPVSDQEKAGMLIDMALGTIEQFNPGSVCPGDPNAEEPVGFQMCIVPPEYRQELHDAELACIHIAKGIARGKYVRLTMVGKEVALCMDCYGKLPSTPAC